MLNSIQALRALAAWIVVFHHYMQVAYKFSLTDPVSVALFKYGAIGVDLFFVISGFVIYLSSSGKSQTPKVFAAHRIARIAPAYWLFTLITTATLILAPGIVPLTIYTPEFLLKSLLFIPAQNPSGIGMYPIVTMGWTLNYEMAFYAIFFLSLYLPAKFRVSAIIAGVLLMRALLPYIGGDFIFFKNKIVYEFLFGIGVALIYQKGYISKIPPYVAALLVALAFWRVHVNSPVDHDPYGAGLPCAAILIAALSQERLFSKIGFLGKLGDWSYSTYLCHVLVICYGLRLQQQIGLSSLATFLIITASIAIASWASFSLIERPISRFAKNYLNPKPAYLASGQ
ncbi:acyltransferase [Pseudomonas lundensis]|nr:acyltransferase [Pseudomonas lundensis]